MDHHFTIRFAHEKSLPSLLTRKKAATTAEEDGSSAASLRQQYQSKLCEGETFGPRFRRWKGGSQTPIQLEFGG